MADATVTARIAKIKELFANPRRTTEQTKELERLLTEQTAWEKAHPSEAMSLSTSYDVPKPATPTATPAPTKPAGRTREEELAATDAGQAARAAAIAEGKSPAVADAIALQVYSTWKPTAPAPATPEGEDSFSRHYEAQGEALESDYRSFALHLRDLADKGELVGADGKPLPMYSREQIAEMDIPALKKLVAANPGRANTFFERPPAEVAESLAGTGRTGVGKESGMVELPPVPTGAPAPAKPAPAPAPAVEPPKPAEPAKDEIPYEATMASSAPTEPKAEAPKKKKFGEMAGDLYKKYGVPVLDILQAVGYQRGGITKPTNIENKYQERLAQDERDYQKKLEEDRASREEATYQKRIADQRTWESQQAELARIAEKEARGEELSSREKIARMQIEATRAAARASGAPASIIPD